MDDVENPLRFLGSFGSLAVGLVLSDPHVFFADATATPGLGLWRFGGAPFFSPYVRGVLFVVQIAALPTPELPCNFVYK